MRNSGSHTRNELSSITVQDKLEKQTIAGRCAEAVILLCKTARCRCFFAIHSTLLAPYSVERFSVAAK
jgi:hypothetical protein